MYEVLISEELIPAAKKVFTGREDLIYGEVIMKHLSSSWKYDERWFFYNGARIIRIDTLKKRLKNQ